MILAPYRLADGTLLMLRPIQADDKHQLHNAFARLSAETARLRFLAPKPRLSAAELRYLTEIDGDDHVAVLAVRADNPDFIVGVRQTCRKGIPNRWRILFRQRTESEGRPVSGVCVHVAT